jgi:two-component system, cell cycle response regulator
MFGDKQTTATDVLVGKGKPTILIVEDDPVSALLVRKLLEGQGIPTDHAINGREAVEMHAASPYRLVISDWMMPEMSGIDLCRELRSQDGPYLYFILCSAKGRPDERMEAFKAGIDDFLSKPLDREELLTRLTVARRILGSEDILRERKAELEKAGNTLQEMNDNLVIASRRFAELFNGLPVACFTFDETGLIHEWNRSAEKFFLVPSYRAFQYPVWEVLGPQSYDFWSPKRIQTIVENGEQASCDWSFILPSGELRNFVCNVFAMHNQAGEFVGAISANLDITDRLNAQRRVEEQVEQINEFAQQLEIQKRALEEANSLLALRADTDGLTNVLNHRRMQGDLELRFREARLGNKELSVILMDVDKFKDFNDSFGHQAGDDVLRDFAAILRGLSRQGEAVARYGGEEFAVILNGCGKKQAIAAAERFRKAIQSATWAHRQITASFGVSTLDAKCETPKDLIAQADVSLYYSKQAGRDRVTHFEDLPADYLANNKRSAPEQAA